MPTALIVEHACWRNTLLVFSPAPADFILHLLWLTSLLYLLFSPLALNPLLPCFTPNNKPYLIPLPDEKHPRRPAASAKTRGARADAQRRRTTDIDNTSRGKTARISHPHPVIPSVIVSGGGRRLRVVTERAHRSIKLLVILDYTVRICGR